MDLAAVLELIIGDLQDMRYLLELWEQCLGDLTNDQLTTHMLTPTSCRLVDVFLERRHLPGTASNPEVVLRFTAPAEIISRFLQELPRNSFQLQQYPGLPDFTHRYRASRYLN